MIPPMPPSAATASRSADNWLDGVEVLRGIAAVSVMLFHCIGLLPWDVAGTPLAVFRAGWIGVDLFFVISGFVIAGSALRQCESPAYAANFWRARLLRIVPLYYVASIAFLGFVSADALGAHATFQLLAHALFLHSFFPSTAMSINGVTWSLGVEMQFYVAAFVFVPRVAQLPRRRLVVLYLAVVAIVLAWRVGAWSLLRGAGADDALIAHVVAQAPGLIDSFALGSLIRLLRLPAAGFRRSAALAAAAFGLFIIVFLVYDANAATYSSSLPMMALFRSLVAAFGGVALLAAVAAPARLGRAWWPALHLGRISYGVFLWHLPILYLVQRHLPWRGTASTLAVIVSTLLLAHVSYRMVEQPCTRWAKRRAAAAAAPVVSAAAN